MQTPATERIKISDPELFERHLLVALISDTDSWRTISPAITWDMKGTAHQNLWETPLHYAIFRAILEWRELMSGINITDVRPLSLSEIRVQLSYLLTLPHPVIAEHQIEEAVGLYDYIISTIPVEAALAVVTPEWLSWTQNRRVAEAQKFINRAGVVDQHDYMQNIIQHNASLQRTTDTTSAEFGDGMDSGEQLVERISLGPRFRSLSMCLGGGIGRKEHSIFVIPTGGGKTVLACQIAAVVASQKKHVLFISTEQNSRELEPRFFSAQGSDGNVIIPFDTVKDGGDYSKILSATQYESVLRVRSALRGYLHFENWLGSSKAITADIHNCIEQAIAKYGDLSLVILDWIGGALASNMPTDFKRFAYLDAAKAMKVAAEKYNVAAISLAQATANAVNVQRITEHYIAECKTLHHEADNACGVSAMRVNGSEEESAAYADKQYVYFFKSRKSVGKLFPAQRNFSLQRWESM